MAEQYVASLSRIKQWLPFFETASERRDTESWWEPIKETVTTFGLKVKMLVSDRATGLIKLGKEEYLDLCSMPDLFHFQQELSRGIGASIGKAWKKGKQAYYDAKDQYGERKELESAYLKLYMCRNRYQQGVHNINKAIQPFTENGTFKSSKTIEQAIISNIVQISKQSKGIVKEM